MCLGNICRSPLAEAIFLAKIKALGLEEKFQADSCGTSNYNIGCPADPRTTANAARHGIAVNHIARQLTVADFDWFDSIVVMDKANLRHVQALAPQHHREKIQLIRHYEPQPGHEEVPDPYHGGEQDFEDVFQILNRSIDGLVARLV